MKDINKEKPAKIKATKAKPRKTSSTSSKNFSPQSIHKIFLFGMILLLSYLVYRFFSPFLTTLFMSAIISTVAYPLVGILERFGLARIWSVIVIFIAIVLLVVIPASYLVVALVNEAASVTTIFTNTSLEQLREGLIHGAEKVPFFSEKIISFIDALRFEDALQTAGELTRNISGSLIKSFGVFVKQATLLVLHTLILLFSLFYFLWDGAKLVSYIKRIIPLPKSQNNKLFKKVQDLMFALIFGIFGAALAQSIMLGIGLTVAGVENALFWSAIGACLAIIPLVGIAVIWMPIGIYMIVTGDIFWGIGLLLWGTLVVSNIDNIVRPYIMGAGTSLHPFAIMLILLGGVLSFGFKGLVFGPFVLMLLLAFLHIYEIEYGTDKAK